jgi:23S rRNA (adenine2503-C2)-methyltransferase
VCYHAPVADRPSLYDLTRDELVSFIRDLGEPRYRADQLWGWLYAQFAASFEEMHNLPLDLRRRLDETARLHTIEPVAETASDDGLAVKVLFRLADGQLVETVLMHYVDPADEPAENGTAVPSGRHTVCLSTQAGCAMGCTFCATGQMGLVRDLGQGECVEQVVHCARILHGAGERLSNVVFMGMGEPLANWPATWGTVEILTDPDGFGIGARRITISTVGIVPGILRLAEADRQVRLAVSLHAPDDALRNRLVAANRVYGLDEILAACRTYQAATNRRISFEYVLIDRVNDRPAQAAALARRLTGFLAHVNLIPLNPTPGSPLRPSSYDAAVAFQRILQDAGIPTTLRMRRGIEIQAGCGQLRSRASEGRLGRTIPAPAAVGDG